MELLILDKLFEEPDIMYTQFLADLEPAYLL